MTLALETFMGRVLGGRPWSAVFEHYDVLAGRGLVPRAALDLGRTVRFLPLVRGKAAKAVKAVPRSGRSPETRNLTSGAPTVASNGGCRGLSATMSPAANLVPSRRPRSTAELGSASGFRRLVQPPEEPR